VICVVLQSACNTEVDKSNNSRYLITGTGYYYIHGALHMFIGSDAQGGGEMPSVSAWPRF